MITSIEVNGFKSLNKFKLELNQGLNILVGPNGSGKTNIILFFEFLSHIGVDQIGNAVSKIGGAGSIFKKISFDEYEKDIYFKICGTKRFGNKKYLRYEYEAKITNSFQLDNIHYSFQALRIKNQTSFKVIKNSNTKWDFDVNINYFENNTQVDLININHKRYKRENYFTLNNQETTIEETKITKEYLELYLNKRNLNHNNLIPGLVHILEGSTFAILSDLKGGETFNVVPSKVKETEDAANPPGIKKDGSGLVSTLYAMKKGKQKEQNNLFPFLLFNEKDNRKYKKETLEQIVNYLKLANNTIDSLEVLNDPFDNRLVLKISIETKNYNAVLPLSAMSDGTIKWLSLITAILTSDSIFSIEEPENFLHPWMQAEIVRIMRNHIDNKKMESCVIMTTHSESLLNYSEPKELVLVEFKEGQTKATRINDIELIRNEISNSGFGLGHFYFSNSLNND